MPGIRLKTVIITFINFAVSSLTSIRMASGINIYSELLISRIRIVDINNANCWYQQFASEQGKGHSEWPMTQVTHWALDPWPMGHRHRARHPILAQALHRFIDYPALHLDIAYVHTPLSCYIIAHDISVSKLHTQTPVNLEFVNWKLKHCIT